MEEYMLCDLHWVYDLQRKKLSVFAKNSSGTRVKNICTGEVFDIPKYRGDYGSEYRLDFEKILDSKGCIKFGFKELYAMVGTDAFLTLKNEAKQVEKELNRMRKDYKNDYYSFELPEIDIYQYMSASDIVSATRRAEPILQRDESIKRRERECANKSSYEF